MAVDLPALVAAQKDICAISAWIERGADGLEFTVSVEENGVVIEGLALRARGRRSLPDREIMFQLEYHAPQIIGGPICRIEWRPLSTHNNKGIGPKVWRYRIIKGTHHHCFDLNLQHS